MDRILRCHQNRGNRFLSGQAHYNEASVGRTQERPCRKRFRCGVTNERELLFAAQLLSRISGGSIKRVGGARDLASSSFSRNVDRGHLRAKRPSELQLQGVPGHYAENAGADRANPAPIRARYTGVRTKKAGGFERRKTIWICRGRRECRDAHSPIGVATSRICEGTCTSRHALKIPDVFLRSNPPPFFCAGLQCIAPDGRRDCAGQRLAVFPA